MDRHGEPQPRPPEEILPKVYRRARIIRARRIVPVVGTALVVLFAGVLLADPFGGEEVGRVTEPIGVDVRLDLCERHLERAEAYGAVDRIRSLTEH
jgi:hypothetical protein